MISNSRFKLGALFAVFYLCAVNIPVIQADPVEFSGKVSKVILEQKKIAIVDSANKRVTVKADEKTRFNGCTLESLKKDDNVSGKYEVTNDGRYMAIEVNRK